MTSSRSEFPALVGSLMAAAAGCDHRDPAPHRAHRIYPLMQAPLAMGVCSVLLGFTLGSVQPMVMSLLLQLAPEQRHGDAVAMLVIVINASSVGIPMVSGAAGLIGAGVSGARMGRRRCRLRALLDAHGDGG